MVKTISLKLDENLFLEVKKVSEILNISCSEFIRNAIREELAKKNNDFIVRMSNVDYCNEKEEKELTDFLNTLSNDDLKIVKRENIKL